MDRRKDESMPGNPDVLVIESDAELREALALAIECAGLTVLRAGDGLYGLRTLFSSHPRLVVLGLSLPRLDGWSVLERIRDATDTPVIILGRQQVQYRLRAFRLQAQDYVPHPFDVQEIVLRVKAILDQATPVRQAANAVYDDGTLRIDGWNRVVTVHNQPLAVGQSELCLLRLLIRQPGRLVRYSDIVEALSIGKAGDAETALHCLIHRVRRKLGIAAPGTNYIVTQRGLGIRLSVR